MPRTPPMLDCVVIGGGPAGLTSAVYLARFRRRFLLVDSGESRAANIPVSHNNPGWSEGIGGVDLLARIRAHADRYGAPMIDGSVTGLDRLPEGGFRVRLDAEDARGFGHEVLTEHVLLATGADDIEPDLPNVEDAVRRGIVRYCPICDGFESIGHKVAVIGYGKRGMGEALFIRRTYCVDVTLMTLGHEMELNEEEWRELCEADVKIVAEPVSELDFDGERITAVRVGGREHRFDVLYSALGTKVRSDLAVALGAEHDENGALAVDEHNQTTVSNLYAAGDVVRGLSQVVVAMGHAAIASTDVHNHCRPATVYEENRTEPEAAA